VAFELPDRFTPEYINGLEWRETQYSKLELCEMGMLRRPLSAQIPGTLLYATPNKEFPPRYRITKLGGTKEKYVVDVEAAMIELFSSFRNKQLLAYKYLTELKLLCMEYNERYFTREMSREDSKLLGENAAKLIRRRRCAGVNGRSCGKMIYDYRCSACWIRIRGGNVDDIYDNS